VTSPDDRVPGRPIEGGAIFAGTADDYARYRPGLPGAAVRLLAESLRERPAPALLDLGTGTGQVPLALLQAVPGLAHVEAVDVSQQMLDQAQAELAPVLGRCTLHLVLAPAATHASLPAGRGAASRAPDLITCCRSFHWMNRPTVLARADRVAAPDAAVAIMGDGSLWTHHADWTRALRELVQHFLGADRRAGARGTYRGPHGSFEDDLAASAWNEVTEHRFPVTRTWTPEDVLGYLRSTSFAHPQLFGERHAAFEDQALGLLHAHAVDGVLVEEAVFTVLLARRGGGAP